MRILVPSTKNKVYLAWLRSELYRTRDSLTQEEIQIIEKPDLDNTEVPANLSISRGHRVSNFPPAADHKTKIEAMAQSINSNIQDIIMISSSHAGPYTIIDGTHRSSLLAMRGILPGTKAYLGVANDLSQCVWTQEWVNYQNTIVELNRLVDAGHLW